jgi:hypothetical protein
MELPDVEPESFIISVICVFKSFWKVVVLPLYCVYWVFNWFAIIDGNDVVKLTDV